MYLKYLLILLFSSIVFNAFSQTVEISEVKLEGDSRAISFFNHAPHDSFLIDHGMIISTGDAEMALHANDRKSFSTALDDAHMAHLVHEEGSELFDAVVLSFEVVPQYEELVLSYVFASEEYGKSVCSQTADLFEISIKKKEESDDEEVMINLVPNTSDMVSIHSICDQKCPENNIKNHADYYVNNDGGQYLQYNGYTKLLDATAQVQPGETYVVCIRLADVGDKLFDSAVLLPENFMSSRTAVTRKQNVVQKTKASEEVNISPSIVREQVYVQSEAGIKAINFYNSNGVLVSTKKVNGSQEIYYNTADFAQGIYVVQVQLMSGVVESRRVLVAR